MTQKELADKYGFNENTVYKNFLQVQRSILKNYGIEIEKIGRGKKAQYIEKEKN